MHRKQILGALIFAMLSTVCASRAVAKTPAPTGVSDSAPVKSAAVSPEFDDQVNDMIFALKKVKDPVKRYAVFVDKYKKLSDWRTKNKNQSEDQKISMSLFMDTLATLPEKKDFKVIKCPEYRQKAKTMQSYKDGAVDPEVASALEVVRVICQ